MSRHPMPPADAAWLHMDRRTNPMVVNSLVMLGGTPDLDAVAELLERRFVAPFPRFRQRVSDPLGAPRLRGRPVVRHPQPPAPTGAAGSRRPGGAGGAGRRPGHPAARPEQAALARLPDRRLRGRLGGALADPPLHRRRDRPLPRPALDRRRGGRRARAGAAPRWAEHPEPAHRRAPWRRLGGAPARRRRRARGDGVACPSGPPSRAGRHRHARRLHRREVGCRSGRRRDRAEGAARREPQGRLVRRLPAGADQGGGPAAGRDDQRRARHGAGRRRSSEQPRRRTARSRRRSTRWCPFNLRPPDEPIPADLGNDFALILLALPLGRVEPDERLREVHRPHEDDQGLP